MKNLMIILMLLVGFVLVSCNTATEKTTKTEDTLVLEYKKVVPEWSRNSVIYEVNIRHYTPEGTFKAFEAHIPRLKELGVDILWIMPIHPVGLKNRKLTEKSLGSPYSVQDYLKVNPDYGTMDDFKSLVKLAHDNGMKVIIDWVANHTSWDNVWVTSNPEFYTRNEKGEMTVPAGTDWEDTADLNYDNDSLRSAMTEALRFWIKEADIDGYRCDVAGMVPVDFWDNVRAELDKIKPVFMLAEAEEAPLQKNAFDMAYGWNFHHVMNAVAQGKKDVSEIDNYFASIDTVFTKETYLMNFITNHDENAWNGTEKERMGAAVNAMAVLSFTIPGMPLIYTGQEVGLAKRLSFFEKDLVKWDVKNTETEFYKSLIKLKKANPALDAGTFGGELKRINSSNDKAVYAFVREKEGNKVVVVLNLTKKAEKFTLNGNAFVGKYTDYFANQESELAANQELNLPAWGYKVFVSKN